MPQRWKIFSILALMFMLGFFYRVSLAVTASDLSADLALTAAQLGVLSGIFFYVFAIVQIPLGPLLDSYGGRRVISVSGIITATGALTLAMAPGYPAALAGRLLLGVGTACILMGSLKVYTNWFSAQEFPAVSGLMVAAGNIGSLCATAPLAFALSHYGWRRIFLVSSLAQTMITIAVYFVVLDEPALKEATEISITKKDLATRTLQSWRIIASSPAFWLAALLAFFWYANYMVLLALWGGPYLMEAVGLSRVETGNMLLCISLGFIIGSLLLGRVINFMSGSLEKTILCGQTLLMIAMTAMLGPAESFPRPLLTATFFLIGLASSSGAIIYPLARELVPHNIAATAMTCVNFFLLMGAASMQQIMGEFVSLFPHTQTGYPAHAYHGAFLIPICGLGITLILFACTGRWKRK